MNALPTKRVINNRLQKQCAVCGRDIKIVIYTDRKYRGGHYFGKIPLHSEKELRKALSFGTKTLKGFPSIQVMNKDPKPYRLEEYWECPSCYRGTRKQ